MIFKDQQIMHYYKHFRTSTICICASNNFAKNETNETIRQEMKVPQTTQDTVTLCYNT